MRQYILIPALSLSAALSVAQHVGTAIPPSATLNTDVSTLRDPALCLEEVTRAIQARLSTANRDIYIYHWFYNGPENPYAIDLTGKKADERIRQLTLSKTLRFEKAQSIENGSVGPGMYFAADPISSVNYGVKPNTDDNIEQAVVVRLKIKKGTRVMRVPIQEFIEKIGIQIPLGNACLPEKFLSFEEKGILRTLFHKALKDLNVATIAYPFAFERYDKPLNLKTDSEDDPERENAFTDIMTNRVAFNVIDKKFANAAEIKWFKSQQIFDPSPLQKNDSMEKMYAHYFTLSSKGEKLQVDEKFRLWADEHLQSMNRFEEIFQPYRH